MTDIYKKRSCCASCSSEKLKTILNLNNVPLAGFFPKKEEINNVVTFPLELQICEDCKLVQTDSVINPDVLFRDYRYLSSIGLSKYFSGVANELNEKYDIKGKDILEFGCNDGVLLKPLSDLGANAIGIDPSVNVSQIARNKGLNVITDYFNFVNFGNKEWENRFDIIISNNTFAHIIDITNTAKAVGHCLKDGGRFIFEVHYLKNLIDELQWDNIYHEHIYYYSVTALKNMLNKYGMSIVDVEKRDIHSGSIRITAEKSNAAMPEKVIDIIKEESTTICDLNFLDQFQNNVLKHISDFKEEIKKAKDSGLTIAGYGASGRANMFCNITGLDSSFIEFIVDESPERCGRYIANTDIPIVGIETLKEKDVDILIIFAWNYSKMIVEKTGFKEFNYMIAFPSIKYFKREDVKELDFKSI
jgi:predicted RNA methylase